MGDIRLQKLLSECGIASRRKAEEMINQGRVKVNGHPAGLGDKANLPKDIVTVDGRRIALPDRLHYIMLNKPRGYVTTMNDEMGRKCVAELVEGVGGRVYPVGRLDRESEGLLLLTNDGEFANTVIHPAHHIPKVYRVTLRPAPTDEQLQMFRDGMMLEGEKTKTSPADIMIISGEISNGAAANSVSGAVAASDKSERVVAEIVLYEGRNRQIRRMFEQMKIEVARLKRVAVGNVKLGMLPTGKWRELEPREVQALQNKVLTGPAEPKRAAAVGEVRRHGIHRPRR